MDILDILADGKRVIVYSSQQERSIFTWDGNFTIEWWRPVVRMRTRDYKNKKFDPNDWEVTYTRNLPAPLNYAQAREIAQSLVFVPPK